MFRPYLKVEKNSGEVTKLFHETDDKQELERWMADLVKITRSNPDLTSIKSITPVFESKMVTGTFDFEPFEKYRGDESYIGYTISKLIEEIGVPDGVPFKVTIEAEIGKGEK